MILSEPLCLGVFVAGKDLSEWVQKLYFPIKTEEAKNFRFFCFYLNPSGINFQSHFEAFDRLLKIFLV